MSVASLVQENGGDEEQKPAWKPRKLLGAYQSGSQPQLERLIGLIVETPDVATWHAALQTDEASEAMQHEGVRRNTILELVEG